MTNMFKNRTEYKGAIVKTKRLSGTPPQTCKRVIQWWLRSLLIFPIATVRLARQQHGRGFFNRQGPRRRLKVRWVEVFNRGEKHDVMNSFRIIRIQVAWEIAIGVSHHEIEMLWFIHIVEEWKRGGKNKDVNGGEQAKQKNYFSLTLLRRRSGWIGVGVIHNFSKYDAWPI
jgi:hypothetical protein